MVPKLPLTLAAGPCVPAAQVGQFKQLVRRVELDGHLRKQLLAVLVMNPENWDEVRLPAVT